MRGRVSPRACSSPAASKRWKASGDNLAKRFTESGAKLACLCSSDKVYEREAEAIAKALAEAGAARVYLAGKPGANKAALEQGRH